MARCQLATPIRLLRSSDRLTLFFSANIELEFRCLWLGNKRESIARRQRRPAIQHAERANTDAMNANTRDFGTLAWSASEIVMETQT